MPGVPSALGGGCRGDGDCLFRGGVVGEVCEGGFVVEF